MKSLILFAAFGLVSCVQGHCRRQVDAPAAAQQLPAVQEALPVAQSDQDRVFVYKYDGSLQCGQGKAIPLDVMAKQLGTIPVTSMMKKSDGLMHIQVCGSTSGKANVYEIPAKFLRQAEGKGFKKWTYQ